MMDDEPDEIELPFEEPEYEEIWCGAFHAYVDRGKRNKHLAEQAARFADNTVAHHYLRFGRRLSERRMGFREDQPESA